MSIAEESTTHAPAELKVIEDATCTFCGCVCDDMQLTVEGNKITQAKNACVLAAGVAGSSSAISTLVRALTSMASHAPTRAM